MDDDSIRRLALNEAVARDVNEATGDVAKRWLRADEPIRLICECSQPSCGEHVHVLARDYAEVRAHNDRFLVVDSHVSEEIERRVGTAGDATIVEKLGPGRQVAEESA